MEVSQALLIFLFGATVGHLFGKFRAKRKKSRKKRKRVKSRFKSWSELNTAERFLLGLDFMVLVIGLMVLGLSFRLNPPSWQDQLYQLPELINPQDAEVGRVINSLDLSTENEWLKIERIYNWVLANTMYLDDWVEFFKPPSETIRTGRGDCEDLSIMLCSLLLRAGFKAKVVVGSLTGDIITYPAMNHAWVEVWYENRWVILDPSTSYPATRFLDELPPLVTKVGGYGGVLEADPGGVREYDGALLSRGEPNDVRIRRRC